MTLISPALAAWYFRVPVGTVYRWASQDRWPKHGTPGRREYDIADIQASYMKRRGPEEITGHAPPGLEVIRNQERAKQRREEAAQAADTLQRAQFWAEVDKTGDCWIWTGDLINSGYGSARWRGRRHPAHRVAYMLEVGKIPTGYEVDHMCVNPVCVRPSHLQACTPRENKMLAKLRCRASGDSLTWDEVISPIMGHVRPDGVNVNGTAEPDTAEVA